MTDQNDISLNKFISETGFCSRRDADKLIEAGRVTVNGKVPKSGNRVNQNDVVSGWRELTTKRQADLYCI